MTFAKVCIYKNAVTNFDIFQVKIEMIAFSLFVIFIFKVFDLNKAKQVYKLKKVCK